MSVTGAAVHWWEERQLRILVLCSLAIQFLLFFFSLARRYGMPRWARSMLWLAYLGGDAMPIYALATLFNRHKDNKGCGGTTSNSSSLLEMVWAPVLLIHLGGQDAFTAYNIEDNELWSRHLLTAVSQVTVAIYVFCKTWPRGGGDKRLLQAAIVLFVPGVLKCFAKPWALKRASIYSLVGSPAAAKQKEGEMYRLEEYVKGAKDLVQEQTTTKRGEAQATRASSSMEDEGKPAGTEGTTSLGGHKEQSTEEGEAQGARASSSMEDEGKPAGTGTANMTREMVKGHNVDQVHLKFLAIINEHSSQIFPQIKLVYDRISNDLSAMQNRLEMSKLLFADLSSSYPRRLRILKDFWGLTEERAYGSVRRGLATAFLLLYTKVKTMDINQEDERLKPMFFILVPLMLSRLFLPWAAIGLFYHSHREAYNDIDVKITTILLCCTAVLEFFSVFHFISDITEIETWTERVAQRSFIGGYVARSTDHSSYRIWMESLLLGCKQGQETDRCYSSRTFAVLVHRYLKAGWRKKIDNAASYRRFNDNRGHWAIEDNELEDHLSWSIEGPFDESVLRWHLATDLCFFLSPLSSDDKSVLCTQMSNYMAHLLLVNPEMLLPGSRRNLFETAQKELDAMFKNNPQPGLDKKTLAEKIVSELESSSSSQQGGSSPSPPETFIHEAWMIAQKLRGLDDEKMWEVIQGVWVEMLCYSAGRCRGYLHAKALGQGGEFLSYVWLLMFLMGMETFTDKLQREDHPRRHRAASASEAHADAAGVSAAPTTSKICTAEDMV